MKIHYLSDHSVLEYDEVQLLTDLGHDVFSNGAYLDPAGHPSLPRPGIKGGKYFKEYADIARGVTLIDGKARVAKNDLPSELIEPFDVLIFMHNPHALFDNWHKIKHKKVIWRSIGQSVEWIEQRLQPLVAEGLIIVRYSPKEQNIPSFAGVHRMIRFYKDEDVYKGWTGKNAEVVNFSQALKGRRQFCHYDEIIEVITQLNGRVYGPGNEDLGIFNGGNVPFEQMLDIMRDSRALIYAGTWPAAYTLSFIEALVMGLPVVAVSKAIAHVQGFEGIDFYEVDEILAEISGFVCDNALQMAAGANLLIKDYDLAIEFSRRSRELGISLFGKSVIAPQWEELLATL